MTQGLVAPLLDFGGTPSMCVVVSNREKPMDTTPSSFTARNNAKRAAEKMIANRVTDPMRRNSGDRWLIWSDLGEHQRSYRVSSNRPPRRSGTGCDRPIVMKAA